MGRHLRRLGSQFSVDIPTDEDGYLGRECPDCKSYFKILPGTGLEEVTDCICAYCGHKSETSDFATQEQIDYATSVVTRHLMGAFNKDLKDMARSFNRKASGGFLSLKMSVKSSTSPIRYYEEKELETHIECNACTLKYAIYGVFGYCPDCGIHNSLQILDKNLELARKEVDLADTTDDSDFREHLVGDALENAVSAFDGFARQTVVAHLSNAKNAKVAEKMTFQNLATADTTFATAFGLSLNDGFPDDLWSLLVRCFQKRHLLAHKMGVVDEKYLASTNDTKSVVGRKVPISADEVGSLLNAVSDLGRHLVNILKKSESQSDEQTQS